MDYRGVAVRMQKEFDSGSKIHYLTGMDVNKMQASDTSHLTDTIGLCDAPPQLRGPVRELIRAIRMLGLNLRDLFLSSIAFVIFYGVVFTVVIVVAAYLFDEVSFNNISNIKAYGISLIVVISILNFFDTLEWWHWRFAARVRVWPRSILPSRLFVQSSEILFGGLKVTYLYNDEGFYVISSTNMAAMSIDISLITKAEVDPDTTRIWSGDFGTNSVKIMLDARKAPPMIRIHGAYFEKKQKNGDEEAQKFVNGLNRIIEKRLTRSKSEPDEVQSAEI